MKLKPGSWLGYSATTTDADARKRTAQRLGCEPQELEVKSNGGATLVRRRGDSDGDS